MVFMTEFQFEIHSKLEGLRVNIMRNICIQLAIHPFFIPLDANFQW